MDSSSATLRSHSADHSHIDQVAELTEISDTLPYLITRRLAEGCQYASSHVQARAFATEAARCDLHLITHALNVLGERLQHRMRKWCTSDSESIMGRRTGPDPDPLREDGQLPE